MTDLSGFSIRTEPVVDAGWRDGAAHVAPLDADRSRPLGGWPKRMIDLSIALLALILAAPLMLLIAAIIRLTVGGPAIFVHKRVGFKGDSFNCLKFRTMTVDAERRLAELLARDPDAAEEWNEHRKLRNDPRITALGRVLRKSSLDELPQLFNVIRGEMSCVGPRPIVSDELERYGAFVGDYLRARPGLTGLWQITGRSRTDYSGRVLLDTQYVRNWSLGRDLAILARTSVAVMRFEDVS